ncbi:helix-turn-helix domain-containing protein [Paenibacillus oceani]|uniref:Helix-turn-helix transcriptional regulator n=1 Tax=Paenibacillus oceani TaxID=2772510 RepID=A0A927GY55_9BACL|nr:AraC family transcriptional regulator [Paenibacillus oceani]MBD2861245.1 helix-turn-helix transcriptional regulator [Paenibacillus oceani]
MNVIGFVPQVRELMYWHNKEKFILYEDTSAAWTLFAMESGSFYYEIGEEKGTAAFGDIVICPPLTPFRRVVITPLCFFVIKLDWGKIDSQPADAKSLQLGTTKISFQNTSRLVANYNMLKKIDALHMHHVARNPLSNHYLYDIWLLYSEEAGMVPWTAVLQRDSQQPDRLMAKAEAMIQKQAFQPIALNEIASSLGLSTVRLIQKFKACYGDTPAQYQIKLRLERAKKLLLETNLTLDQISDHIGYQNGFYLNRIFKKHMNMTPGKYRKVHRV